MIQRDENFLSMCMAVKEVLNNHTAVWTPRVAFANQVGVFYNLLSELALSVEGAEIVSTGATEDKSIAEAAAVKLAVNLAKRASVYALDVDKMELHDQLRVTKSSLLRRPDTMTLAKLRDIHTRLRVVVADLADYGVVDADLIKLNALNDAFDLLISHPRSLIVERKGYNKDAIPGLLTGLREVLYKMDSLVNLFNENVLSREYKDARIIVDLGSRRANPIEPEPPV